MRLRFSIPELHAYLAEVFPETGGRYEIVEMAAGRLKVRMTAAAGDLRPGGTVSGPAMFALADCAFYMATLALVGREALTVTTSAAIDFMRQPLGGLVAEARVLKLGRSLAVGDVLSSRRGSRARSPARASPIDPPRRRRADAALRHGPLRRPLIVAIRHRDAAGALGAGLAISTSSSS